MWSRSKLDKETNIMTKQSGSPVRVLQQRDPLVRLTR